MIYKFIGNERIRIAINNESVVVIPGKEYDIKDEGFKHEKFISVDKPESKKKNKKSKGELEDGSI